MVALRMGTYVFYFDKIGTEITGLFCMIIYAFNFSPVQFMALSPVDLLHIGQKHTYLMSLSGIYDVE